ncbi:MAG: pilus assembly protein PilM [Oscillospiraceae bacterium]|nr:pilus assembly protein PilM [Oscillospiraceae bacterium]
MLSIDVTDKQIKLVRGSLAGSKIKINDVEMRDVPEDCIVNGYVTEIPPVADLIIKILADKRISEKEVIVCINSSSILYKELELPKPKALKNTTAIEAMIITQMGISSDYNISYSIVGEGTNAEGAETIKVMATACPQRMIDGYQALFNQTGLKLKQINVSNNCITRLIMNTPKLKEAMPFMCIQVDPDFVNINLYENGQLALSRYVKIDPADYDDNPDYVNIAVFDNLYRMIQFIGQRPGAQKLKQIMFYGVIKDFVALSTSLQQFDSPSHVLSMPSNIVKYCEVDFSRFANAIGAFYKVDPLKDHVNLLESMAVVTKQSVDTLPLKILLSAAVAVGAVGAAWFVLDQIDRGVVRETKRIEEQIEKSRFDEKEKEMEWMLDVSRKFIEYRDSVRLSHVLYDFLPRGDLPQIREQLDAGLEEIPNVISAKIGTGVRNLSDDPGEFYAYHDIKWNRYVITLTLFYNGENFASDYVDALNAIGFYENISYTGFKTIERSGLPAPVVESVPGGVDTIRRIDLTLRLKGGHVFEEDGSKYDVETE